MVTPATPTSARRHALTEATCSAEYAASMSAACLLLAIYLPERQRWLLEQARIWRFYTSCDPAMSAPGWRSG
ncbi:MAG: hypothetical protein GY772_25430 [bacterium]|nr:hypothetical protein [bacterium]